MSRLYIVKAYETMRAIDWNQFLTNDRNVCGRYFLYYQVTGVVVTVPHRVETFQNRAAITTKNLPPYDRLVYNTYVRRTETQILQELRRIFGGEENGEGRYVYLGGESNAHGNVDDVVWEDPYRDEVEWAGENVNAISNNAGIGTTFSSDDHEGHGGKLAREN